MYAMNKQDIVRQIEQANEQARCFKENAIRLEEEKFQHERNRRGSQMLKVIEKRADQEKLIVAILKKYATFFLSTSREPEKIAKEILAAISPPDDLAEIKSALGLPDDTPEPLVGVIWDLQQRLETLERWVRDA